MEQQRQKFMDNSGQEYIIAPVDIGAGEYYCTKSAREEGCPCLKQAHFGYKETVFDEDGLAAWFVRDYRETVIDASIGHRKIEYGKEYITGTNDRCINLLKWYNE